MLAFHGSKFHYWEWSVCQNLWKTLNEEFAGKFEPSNVVATKISPNGLKVQLLQEIHCHPHSGRCTTAESLVADNTNGCQPGLTFMAPTPADFVAIRNHK
eukprot:TRINITY_DN17681_c0_g1_i2.p1 TRINITY_DN17681_c0_g1~~TRINITY_DN17681_c0_g1_i2.p1  ORF type:complete len:100 (-),score=7.69 TRINITY_DN17681_c0_g1_i2:219-518(-)